MSDLGESSGGKLTRPSDEELGMDTDLWYKQAAEAGGDLMVVADVIAAERARRLKIWQEQQAARTQQLQDQLSNMVIADCRPETPYFVH